jgi:large subunit ribosomal protein L47
MRRSGLRGKRLVIDPSELPKPVVDPKLRSKLEGDPDHGLWGFFNQEKTLLSKPEADSAHGKSSQHGLSMVSETE